MLKKTTWLASGQIVGNGLAFVFYVVLAREFGKSDIGDYAFAFSMASIFGLCVEFGFRPLLTRNVARDRASIKTYFGTVLAIQLGLTFVVGISLYVLSLIAEYSNELTILLLFAFASMAINGIAWGFVAYLEAIEAMDKSALLHVVLRVTSAVLGLALILFGAPLRFVVLGHVAGSIAYLAMALYWVQRHFGPIKFHVDRRLARSTLVAALPFALIEFLYQLYSKVDIIMLHHLVGEAETGQYAVAVRLVMTPVVFAYLVGIAMYPTLSRSSKHDAAARDALFLGTLKWLAIFGIGGAVLLFSVGGELLITVFGQQFAGAAGLVKWMAILFFIDFVLVAYGQLLFATDREHTGLRVRLLSVGLNVVLNFLLILRWGAYGAVLASVISQGFLLAALHWLCARSIPAHYTRRACGILVAGAMGVLTSAILHDLVSWPIVGALTLIVTSCAVVITGTITPADYRQLRLALRGVKSTGD